MEPAFNIKNTPWLPIGIKPKEKIVWESNMEYYTDEDMKRRWSEKHGRITTITYMVYGDLGKRTNLSINYAIRETISGKKFAQVLEEVDYEMAELYGLYQGTCIQWVFPDKLEELNEILGLIESGLDHFRIKHECIGATVDVYARTT